MLGFRVDREKKLKLCKIDQVYMPKKLQDLPVETWVFMVTIQETQNAERTLNPGPQSLQHEPPTLNPKPVNLGCKGCRASSPPSSAVSRGH